MINDVFSILGDVPWLHIVVSTIIVFLIGWVWYGVAFREQYMKLMGKKDDEKDNWLGMGVQFIALLSLALLIGIFSLAEAPLSFVSMLGLIVVVLLMSLAGFLFQCGNNKKALRMWGIVTGYEVVCILVIAAIIKFV